MAEEYVDSDDAEAVGWALGSGQPQRIPTEALLRILRETEQQRDDPDLGILRLFVQWAVDDVRAELGRRGVSIPLAE